MSCVDLRNRGEFRGRPGIETRSGEFPSLGFLELAGDSGGGGGGGGGGHGEWETDGAGVLVQVSSFLYY